MNYPLFIKDYVANAQAGAVKANREAAHAHTALQRLTERLRNIIPKNSGVFDPQTVGKPVHRMAMYSPPSVSCRPYAEDIGSKMMATSIDLNMLSIAIDEHGADPDYGGVHLRFDGPEAGEYRYGFSWGAILANDGLPHLIAEELVRHTSDALLEKAQKMPRSFDRG
jgi:hypothetical protein